MRHRTMLAIFLISFVFAWLRMAGMKSPAFQGLAHIWVGLLFGAWLGAENPSRQRLPLWFALYLTLVEAACAFVFRL